MKLKYALLASALTTVAAVMLLTFALPQTVEAWGGQSFTVHCGCGQVAQYQSTPKLAKGLCGTQSTSLCPGSSMECVTITSVINSKGRELCQ